MLSCIKVSLCEQISIRYTLKSLKQYGKTAKTRTNCPISLRIFNYSYIFVQVLSKNSCNL